MMVHLTQIFIRSLEILVWHSSARERIISDGKFGTFENCGKKIIYKLHLIHLENTLIQCTFIYSLNEA